MYRTRRLLQISNASRRSDSQVRSMVSVAVSGPRRLETAIFIDYLTFNLSERLHSRNLVSRIFVPPLEHGDSRNFRFAKIFTRTVLENCPEGEPLPSYCLCSVIFLSASRSPAPYPTPHPQSSFTLANIHYALHLLIYIV